MDERPLPACPLSWDAADFWPWDIACLHTMWLSLFHVLGAHFDGEFCNGTCFSQQVSISQQVFVCMRKASTHAHKSCICVSCGVIKQGVCHMLNSSLVSVAQGWKAGQGLPWHLPWCLCFQPWFLLLSTRKCFLLKKKLYQRMALLGPCQHTAAV